MGAVGGSMESVSIKGRQFAVASDSEADRFLGGRVNEVEGNGDASARLLQTMTPWRMGAIALVIDDRRGDQEFLQEVADRQFGEWVVIVFTFASGLSYQGQGNIVEEIQYGNGSATSPITFSGPGKLTQQ